MAVTVHRVAVVVDGVVEVDRLRPERQLGVRVVDPGVDDGDRHPCAFESRRPQLGDLHQRLALGVQDPDLPVEAHALDPGVARQSRHGRARNSEEKRRDRLVRPREADAEGGVFALDLFPEPLDERAAFGPPRREDADAPGLLGQTERDEDLDLSPVRLRREEPRVGLLDRTARVGGRPEPLHRERRRRRRRNGRNEREKQGGGVSSHTSSHGK
ncbi:MAG: hypothetical protein IPN83_21015 [Holophagales bacterium]|nr:hypothetical protein [Holophagales bacterium]